MILVGTHTLTHTHMHNHTCTHTHVPHTPHMHLCTNHTYTHAHMYLTHHMHLTHPTYHTHSTHHTHTHTKGLHGVIEERSSRATELEQEVEVLEGELSAAQEALRRAPSRTMRSLVERLRNQLAIKEKQHKVWEGRSVGVVVVRGWWGGEECEGGASYMYSV